MPIVKATTKKTAETAANKSVSKAAKMTDINELREIVKEIGIAMAETQKTLNKVIGIARPDEQSETRALDLPLDKTLTAVEKRKPPFCMGCYFYRNQVAECWSGNDIKLTACRKDERKDGKNVIFRVVEKRQ